MCGCPKHNDPNAKCECICDEHANFEAARDLALSRYDAIKKLGDELYEANAALAKVREVLKPEYLRGRILPAVVCAPEVARLRAIDIIVNGGETPADPPPG